MLTFILKWGVHTKDDPELTGVYIVSFLCIYVSRIVYVWIKNMIIGQDENGFEDYMFAAGLAIVVTIIFWIFR